MNIEIPMPTGDSARTLVDALWEGACCEPAAMDGLRIREHEPLLPSVFGVSRLATATTAAAGLAASQVHRLRGGASQTVQVDSRHAEVAFLSERYLKVDEAFEDHSNPLWGYYRCRDGRHVQLHTTFAHHLAGHTELLGCEAEPEQVAAAVAGWDATALEDAMAARMLPGAMMRSRDEWLATDAGRAVAALPLMDIRRIGDAPPLLSGRGERPLSGLRVLDFSWVWSAPWVGTMLLELGAQVIKVEHAKRPDNLRLAGRVIRDGEVLKGPSKEMSPMFHQVNHGKLGITLNLKAPRAVELLRRLAGMSDVIVENMSPGSMERANLGYDSLKADNPRLVMLAMSAAGQHGALAHMRAYAPTMSSFVGMEALVGYPGEPPIGALNFALSDPSASVHALVPLLAAVRRARATGTGSYIDFSQIESLLGTLRPYLLDRQVHARQPATTGNRHFGRAPHGIYPAAETDAWLSLVVIDDHGWQSLTRLAAGTDWAVDLKFSTLEGRLAQVDELDQAIARWTAQQPRDALVARLRAAGIAASPVLSVEEQWQDPHFAAREIKARVNIPFYGDEDLFKAPWRFSDFSPQIDRCGPSLGEHNDFVFGELLGLSHDEVTSLKASGVIA